MRVLLIEGDSTLSRMLELFLRGERMIVETTDLGEEGIDMAQINGYDVVILDALLPDMTGIDVVQQMRERSILIPVLILSDSILAEERIQNLDAGADACLAKPFGNDELVAHLRALARRPRNYVPVVVRIGALAIDFNKKWVEVEGKPIHLTNREYAFLELLARHVDELVELDMFSKLLYGKTAGELETISIRTLLSKLRKKLGAADYIEAVWGRGYALRNPEPPG